MPVKSRIEHDGWGWAKLFKSEGVQALVDSAGKRIADEANRGASFEAYRYYSKPGSFAALGYVSSTGPTGAYWQQQQKRLSKAVHR